MWLIGAIVAPLIIAIFVWGKIDERRRTEAAVAALPSARAWLAKIPEYQHLEVEVSDNPDTGPGILFTGLLESTDDVERFDKAADVQFASDRFSVDSLVMPGLKERKAFEKSMKK